MPSRPWRLAARVVLGLVTALLLAVATAALVSSDVRFVLRGTYEEARILLRRRPLADLVHDPDAPAAWREKAALVLEARTFADTALGCAWGTPTRRSRGWDGTRCCWSCRRARRTR